MRITPGRLVVLRLYNISIGRFAWGERLFRSVMEHTIIWRKAPEERYTASAGFFDVRELEEAPDEASIPGS